MNSFQIIVVGGGHAGIEAASAAARMNMATALVTISKDTIARMSCNPAVGGLAKSHIVAELDALGGQIGENADYTGIHHRTLNTRKGPAVQATRIQSDKQVYPKRLQILLSNTKGLTIIESLVHRLFVNQGRAEGVVLEDGSVLHSSAVILAPGTFLSGRIHIGDWAQDAGRIGDRAAYELSQQLKELQFEMQRLKTGTPPRLHKDSLDYKKMELQSADSPPPLFSRRAKQDYQKFHVEQSRGAGRELFHMEHGRVALPSMLGMRQMPCYLTKTTDETHEIVRRNLKKSALYGGAIAGTGVRYCPSIEDKIVKFPHHNSHNVFVEPEGRGNVRIYPNGTSNSLPLHVQKELIRSIPGMGKAVFLRAGYAIEYDFCDPRQLWHSLETKNVRNLYMAGQINGTTGYEEAAGQGFVAGVNACLKLRGEDAWTMRRSEGYIGVMIDDLVLKGTEEPYRMFTSRAEFRLILRQDNADIRLREASKRIGLVADEVVRGVEATAANVQREIDRLERGFCNGVSLAKLLRRPQNRYSDLPSQNSKLTHREIGLVETEVKYSGYIEREHSRIEDLAAMSRQQIPRNIDYDQVPSLRLESREKLKRICPEDLGQASRISGVNPSDIAIISVFIKRMQANLTNS